MIRKPFKRYTQPVPKYTHLSEPNVTKSGESAFLIRVPYYNNPYQEQPQKTWWIRGWKKAERIQYAREAHSKRVQETIPYESEDE